jgi:hypothetical protein
MHFIRTRVTARKAKPKVHLRHVAYPTTLTTVLNSLFFFSLTKKALFFSSGFHRFQSKIIVDLFEILQIEPVSRHGGK